jgi:DNA-binding NtrC family response regulator
MPQLVLEDLNLANAERQLCLAALDHGGNIVNAAKLLGITRHAMKRRIIKLRITWPRPAAQAQAPAPSLSPNS